MIISAFFFLLKMATYKTEDMSIDISKINMVYLKFFHCLNIFQLCLSFFFHFAS